MPNIGVPPTFPISRGLCGPRITDCFVRVLHQHSACPGSIQVSHLITAHYGTFGEFRCNGGLNGGTGNFEYVCGALETTHVDSIPSGPRSVTIKCEGSLTTETPDGVVSTPVQPYSRTVNFYYDNTLPTIDVVSPSNGQYFAPDAVVTVAGTGKDDSEIESYAYTIDGDPAVHQLPGGNTWSFPVTRASLGTKAASGEARIHLTARDAVGNGGGPLAGVNFRFDVSPPSVVVDIPAANASVSSFNVISGRAFDDFKLRQVAIQIRENSNGKFWDGTTFTTPDNAGFITFDVTGASDSWSYEGLSDEHLIDLSSYTIIAQALDSVGNISLPVYSTFTFAPTPHAFGASNSLTDAVVTFGKARPIPYGHTNFICASVKPIGMASRIQFATVGKSLQFLSSIQTNDCPGLPIDPNTTVGYLINFKSTAQDCETVGTVVARVDGKTPVAQKAVPITTPTRMSSYLPPENRALIPRKVCPDVNCRVDIYRLVFEASTAEQTANLNLVGLTATEKLVRREPADSLLPMCSDGKPAEESGAFSPGPLASGGSIEPVYGLYAINDIVGLVGFPSKKCATRLLQTASIGKCNVTRGGPVQLRIESGVAFFGFNTSRSDCRTGKPNCAP